MPTNETSPTLPPTWYDDVAADIRTKMRPDDEGCVWVLFTDEEHVVQIGIALESDGRELGEMEYDGLSHIIGELDLPGVVVAVSRADGEPLAEDWELWEQLQARLAELTGRQLLDLVIVGERSWWAVVGGRSNRAA